MTWFKVDDSFHSHAKVWASSPAALGLWVVAGSWSSKSLSDGFVPDHALARLLPGAESLADELVAAGLWTRTKGGYRFHDWEDYNPSAERVEAEREAAKERMRKLRAERKAPGRNGNRSGEQPPNVPGNGDRTSPEVPNPDPNFLQKFSDRPPASPGGAGGPEDPTRDYRTLAAFAAPRDPADAERARRGAAAVRANIRPPRPTNGRPSAFVELVAVTDPPDPLPHPFDDDGADGCLRCLRPYSDDVHAVSDAS